MEFGEVVISNDIKDSIDSFLSGRSYSKYAILVDENTKKHCYPLIQDYFPGHILIEIPSGEEHKTIETCIHIWQQLTDHHFDRKSLLINLGGGVIGDMGGFCACTYKRGIDFINLPTTLLAQVDASVGGKLGIDFSKFKNHIGLFHSPESVMIFDTFLNTLPFAELRSGFAEVIKHHLIRDGQNWTSLTSNNINEQQWSEIIAHSVKIKDDVVKSDPTEKGLRKILNFGHTIGHAVESYFMDIPGQRLLHGEAIAVGMIAETYLSTKYCALDHESAQSIYDYLIKLYKPKKIGEKEIPPITKLAQQDKKNVSDKISLSLLEKIGYAVFDIEVEQNDICHALEKYNDILRKHG